MKQNLELPPEYQEQPQYFDVFNTDETTEAKNSVIEKILAKHHVKTVLDVTCGTGSQVFYLKQHGYQVVGSDFSPELIKIARQKALKQNVNVQFLDGDMRTVQTGQFDAVISIFNAIGHLTKPDFLQALANINKNLHDGGLYVFDIFNLNAMTEKVVHDLAMDWHKTVGDDNIHKTQYSTIDKANGQLTSYNSYEITNGAGTLTKFKSHFTLQIYSATQLRETLTSSGFEVLDQYEMNGSPFIDDKSLSILIVAKKRNYHAL